MVNQSSIAFPTPVLKTKGAIFDSLQFPQNVRVKPGSAFRVKAEPVSELFNPSAAMAAFVSGFKEGFMNPQKSSTKDSSQEEKFNFMHDLYYGPTGFQVPAKEVVNLVRDFEVSVLIDAFKEMLASHQFNSFAAKAPTTSLLGAMFNKPQRKHKSFKKDPSQGTWRNMDGECSTSQSDISGGWFWCNFGGFFHQAWGTRGPMNEDGSYPDMGFRTFSGLPPSEESFHNPFASMSLPGFRGSFRSNACSEKRQKLSKICIFQIGDGEHEAMGEKLQITKSNKRDPSFVVNDMIVDAVKPSVDALGKKLAHQPWFIQMLVIGLMNTAAGVPPAIWQANAEKFFVFWCAAVQAAVSLIGGLCNFVFKPEVALRFTFVALVLVGVFIAYRMKQYRLQPISATPPPEASLGGFGGEFTDGPETGSGSGPDWTEGTAKSSNHHNVASGDNYIAQGGSLQIINQFNIYM